jgi:hypothetical protein
MSITSTMINHANIDNCLYTDEDVRLIKSERPLGLSNFQPDGYRGTRNSNKTSASATRTGPNGYELEQTWGLDESETPISTKLHMDELTASCFGDHLQFKRISQH